MIIVDAFLELLRSAIFLASHLYGGNLGAAILTVPIVIRLVLLPLNVHIGVLQRRRAAVMAQIKPQLDELRKRHANQPERLASATQKVLRENGFSLIDAKGCGVPLLQWPVWASLYFVVRDVSRIGGAFAWILDIARPDRLIAVVAAGLTFAGIAAGATPEHPNMIGMAAGVAIVTFLVVARAAAGVGLYWAGAAGISLVQAGLVRHLSARLD